MLTADSHWTDVSFILPAVDEMGRAISMCKEQRLCQLCSLDEGVVQRNNKQSNRDSVVLTMPHTEQEHSLGDEYEGAGFGMETHHFFQKSSTEDQQNSYVEAQVCKEERLRMRPDILLEGPQYAGIKSSRESAFEEDGTTDSEQIKKGAFLNGEQGMEFEFGEGSEEEQNGMQNVQSETLDEELEALNKEYMELQPQEEDMLRGLKGRTEEEVQKGRAVRHQKALWDKALETRILLQKAFSSANRLPLENIKSVACEANVEVGNAFSRLATSSIETLRDLTEILKSLLKQHSLVDEVDHARKIDSGDRNKQNDNEEVSLLESSDVVDELWRDVDSLYSRFVPFRNSAVDRWQRKTQLSSGAAASRSKLRAFNQSISKQIEAYMKDPSRSLQRMWLKRDFVNIVGMPEGSMDRQHDATSSTDVNIKDVHGDPELIDDSEFYQELLHEFLESSDPTTVGNLHALRKMQNKKRKVVDRRASKGRKIRYTVHDKIVNFMVPVPMNLPPMAENLFSNIFGQQTQVKV